MEFFGLLGEKLTHSLSPKIHKIIFNYLNVDDGYKLFEVNRENLKTFIDGVRVIKIKGFNITIPYKEDVMQYLDEISSEAQRIGAVNTVLLNEGKLLGYNTDYYGFGYLLNQNDIDIKGKVATILGSGGACKAALHYLLDEGISKLYIVSRNSDKEMENIDSRIECISYANLESIKGNILVNSTPVGMYPNVSDSPVGKEVIENYDSLVDLIYNPKETLFLKLGRELNKKSVGGLLMLIGQGIKAEEIWQSQSFDNTLTKKIYNELSKNFK